MTFKKICRTIAIFLGRVFFGSIFITAGITKLINWSESDRMLISSLSDWQFHASFSPMLQDFITALLPWTPLLLISASLVEMIGGSCILLGMRERLGAGLLIFVLIPITFVAHPFWFLEGAPREIEAIMFFKNITILGGLLLVACLGAQAKGGDSEGSLDFS